MNNEFMSLLDAAKSKYSPRVVSPLIEAGAVSSAILTASGNIYTGVCVDTACSLGMCAERNAIGTMLTNGESKIRKLLCYAGEDRLLLPCGACRELLMQLDKDNGEMEILMNISTMKTIKLKSLVPEWWGTTYFGNDD